MHTPIRKAVQKDLPFLLALEKEVFPIFQQNSEKNIKKSISSSFQEVLIIEDETSTHSVGAFTLFKYKKSLRLYSIGISKNYQHKGIGNAIITYCKERLISENFTRLLLEVNAENKQLLNWYESHGFKILKELPNYYSDGTKAIQLEYKIPTSKRFKNIIVINQPFTWERTDINAKIISVKDYIQKPEYQLNTEYRVFNLCSSYKYQSYGYYVSMLASARGQRVIPNVSTIRDVRIKNVIQSVAFDVDELINSSLSTIEQPAFSLQIYFGQTTSKKLQKLAAKLYQIFEAPMFKVYFVKHEKWFIKNIKVTSLSDIDPDEKKMMYDFAANYFKRKRYNYPKLANYKYDIAVLVNPKEENPPSNSEALEKLKQAAIKKNVYLEFITKADIDKIYEFDALFIRETTNVNHYTYELSRFAYAEGMVVIDDPWSIVRCSNKIYQNELFKKNKIKTPETTVLTKNFYSKKQLQNFTYPLVLKQPDSAFSLGVIKVSTKEEAHTELQRLFKISDMILCQEFMFSEFDWRIGVLDNQPLFACKYYMKKDHWQIYNWNSSEEDKSGDFEIVPITAIPEKVVQTALKATSLIGDGLYGVDLKWVNNEVYIIEVNDNPNIDAGVEDSELGNVLYEKIIDSFIKRIEILKNASKVTLT